MSEPETERLPSPCSPVPSGHVLGFLARLHVVFGQAVSPASREHRFYPCVKDEHRTGPPDGLSTSLRGTVKLGVPSEDCRTLGRLF